MDLFGIDPGHYQANDPTANAVMDRLEDPGGCSKQLITTIVSHPSQLLCLGAIDTRVIDLCDQPLVRQPENGTLPTSSYLVGKIELNAAAAKISLAHVREINSKVLSSSVRLFTDS